jgi:hypothetical protein
MTGQSVDRAADTARLVERWTAYRVNPEGKSVTSNLAADIVGRWPDGRVLRGVEDYTERLVKLGTRIPDFRLEVLAHAVNGDLAFANWRAHGTGLNGQFEFFGVDRLRVAGDVFTENLIFFDTTTFEVATGFPLSAI